MIHRMSGQPGGGPKPFRVSMPAPGDPAGYARLQERDKTASVPWVRVDLGATRELVPSRYTLRHTDTPGGELRNWRLEGSCLGEGELATWDTLAIHKDDTTLRGAASQATFRLSQKPRRAYSAS